MSTVASNSAVGTVVERTTGYLTLLHLPGGHTADAAADAVISRLAALPAWFGRTLTWDNGKELARHQRVTAETGIQVYFADPTPPGSAAATRTSTACSASTSPRAPTSAATPPPSSRPSKTNSTTAQETPRLPRPPRTTR
jgi:hypothetical protein